MTEGPREKVTRWQSHIVKDWQIDRLTDWQNDTGTKWHRYTVIFKKKCIIYRNLAIQLGKVEWTHSEVEIRVADPGRDDPSL